MQKLSADICSECIVGPYPNLLRELKSNMYILMGLHLLQNVNKGELIHANQKCKKLSVKLTKLKVKMGGGKHAEE
jgi:hypothetical protein